MKYKILVLLFISSSGHSFSQSLRYAVSMPYIILSAYSNNQSDVLSFTANQAALAKDSIGGIGVYGERRFLIAENSAYTFAAAFPTPKGNFGIQLNYSGFKNFNDNKIGLAYARNVGKRVELGIQLNYYSYQIPTFNGGSALNFEGGIILHFSQQLSGGFHVYNPVGGNIGKFDNEKLASVYKFGLGYDASENFYVGTEIIKEENKAINVVGGVQYHFQKQFFVRAGFLSETGSGFGGAGLAWNNLRIDVSAAFHPQLGFSPGLSLIVNLKNKNNIKA